MRPIDADALYDRIEARYRLSSGEEHKAERVLLNAICDSPTIEAIPVEWLCRKMREEGECENILHAEYIKELIWEWRQEEQEENNG